MPHAFRTRPDHPAVAYLVRLHADLGGRMQANRTEAEKLADNMRAVEAVIRIFDPTYDVRSIAAKRRQQTNPWFRRGTFSRAAMEVLRTAIEPLTVHEIASAVLAARNIVDATPRQRRNLEHGLRSTLEKHAGKTVKRVGEGAPKRWELKA